MGAPSWCLNRKALEKFNRLTDDIPIYNDEDIQEHDDSYHNDTENDNENDNENDENRANSNKKRRKDKKN